MWIIYEQPLNAALRAQAVDRRQLFTVWQQVLETFLWTGPLVNSSKRLIYQCEKGTSDTIFTIIDSVHLNHYVTCNIKDDAQKKTHMHMPTSLSRPLPSSIAPRGFWSWAAVLHFLTPSSHPATPWQSARGTDPAHWHLEQSPSSSDEVIQHQNHLYLRKSPFLVILTSRAALSGAADCTLVFHWVQKVQVQPSPPDLVAVLFRSLLLLWPKVSQAPALHQAPGQIHQGLGHLPRPQSLIWAVKPEEDGTDGKWDSQTSLDMLPWTL